jgi:P4 family phage/plasmid primase-like protien
VIDLSRNCQTIKADHTFFFTNPIPWNYVNARDECPTIDKLFVDWVGEEQKKMLYEICAYCMLSDYPIHRIFCMVGGGRNGKGTFMRLLKKFIGEENVTSTSLDRLTNSRFEAAKLYKKMVAFVGETDFAVMKNTAMLKSLVGQDLIPAEFKNKPPFDFQNTAKIIISTNSLPMTGDKTIGFYSRWIIIDFNGFYETEKDVLSGIPDEEYAALAKKCIKILPEIIHAGRFTGEGNFVQKMEKYEQKSNPMKKFMAEKMVAGGPDDKIAFWEFKNLFLAYLNENKFRRLNENEIKGQLAENNIELVRADFYDNGDRRQWLSLIGYRWRDKEESSQKNGIYGSNGIEVPLNSLYKRIKWNVDTTATINTICYRCGSLGPELYPIKDEITRETIWECLSCQKEKLSL